MYISSTLLVQTCLYNSDQQLAVKFNNMLDETYQIIMDI